MNHAAANRYLHSIRCLELKEAELNQLATYLQHAPPQYSDDVVREACQIFKSVAKVWPIDSFEEAMSAALVPVLNIVCGPVTDDEWTKYASGFHGERVATKAAVRRLMANRRAPLLKPKKPTLPHTLPRDLVIAIVKIDRCPMCLGELNTGWECNSCGYDARQWEDQLNTAGGRNAAE